MDDVGFQTYQACDDMDFIPMDKFQIKARVHPFCPSSLIDAANPRKPLKRISLSSHGADTATQFWKLRQSEYEAYVSSYYPLKPTQGELSDPLVRPCSSLSWPPYS